jgi:hypothetical protein
MKDKKKFGRRLRLSKETIADLEQREVRGGKEPFTFTCTTTNDCTQAITCQTHCPYPCPCEYPITATEVTCFITMICSTRPCLG